MFYADCTACNNITGYIYIFYDVINISLYEVRYNHAIHYLNSSKVTCMLVRDYNQPKYVWRQLIRGPVSTIILLLDLRHSP